MSPGLNEEPDSKKVRTDENTIQPVNDTQSTLEASSQRIGELLSKLPDEVLGEILYWCCPTFSDRFSAPPMSALVLSHVCKRWRKIAFSTPKLWTYTSLGAPRHHCESTTELMLLWVNNSKMCPLVIDIDFCKFAAYKAPDAILPTVMELTELAAELKPAPSDSDKPADKPLTVIAQPSVSIPFPYLAEEYLWSNEMDLPRNYARGSMRLRVATKPCILLGMDGHKEFGPYLVHLDLCDEEGVICLTTEEAMDILKVFQNLRHLTFRLGYAGVVTEDYTLPHLKTLGITWVDEADPTPVLNSLSAPQLQNLELDGQIPDVDIEAGFIWDPLRQFIVRSTPPLRVLDLYKIRCDDIDLLSCLGHCTILERLWLEDCSIGERLVSHFVDMTRPHPLIEPARRTLENLKSLGLSCLGWSGELQH
ncbi:uncharacterized protein FOMMEDRAFT_31944 [Fomitiporia mediterranea MF3/22]|uniref:uncharacterized protein n=1 Tax=Fomitiporia mediterranea (strain MF3/22) TaxID=694068 RepID=UPI0004408881|nr:uncharacterized protein FOMMEDRAFT_31944 [Fomitiporia mediterranea MF3/22]EJC98167.1 hypothetical protein FOMMEDRAFT_31944 [Fomitiporia mediterranea MF3/22]